MCDNGVADAVAVGVAVGVAVTVGMGVAVGVTDGHGVLSVPTYFQRTWLSQRPDPDVEALTNSKPREVRIVGAKVGVAVGVGVTTGVGVGLGYTIKFRLPR